MKKNIDLHIHTDASDGTWSSKEVISQVKSKGINVFSVTDHDSIENILEISKLMEQQNDIKFINGVEVSTTDDNKEVHFTIYDFDLPNENISNIIHSNIKVRENFNNQIIEFLSKKYNEITLDDYMTYKMPKGIGGWRSLNYLKNKGIVNTLSEFFKICIDSGIKQTFFSPEEIISRINGKAKIFLAHPAAYANNALLPKEKLDYYKNIGIHGVECFSPYLKTINDASYYVDYCIKNKLLISCGSDCHGDFIGKRKLGFPQPFDNIEVYGLYI